MIDSFDHHKQIVNCPIFRFSLRVNVSIPVLLHQHEISQRVCTLVKSWIAGRASYRQLARNDVLWWIFFAAQQFRKAILAYSLHE